MKRERTGAVIIAAGITSSEEGFQPLKPVGKLTRAERIILNFKNAGIEDIVVITGNRAAELEHSLKDMGVVFLQNKEYEHTEMIDSARIGFSYMLERCSRILFTTVNVTLFTENTVNRLLQSPADIAIPTYQGQRGHPVMLRKKAVEKILLYDGPGGLRKAIEHSGFPVDWLETEDPGILKQNTENKAFQEILNHHNRQLLHMDLNIGLVREKKFFDSLTASLLGQIASAGSVRSACMRLNISYSRGFQLLALAEEELGFSLTQRQQGGKSGGQAVLTPEGRAFLEKYERFCREIYQLADEKFRETFLGV